MIPKIISHRGRTSRKNPDNTIQSVQDTIDLNIDMVEFDIRRTKDMQIISFHDEYVNGNLISDLNYSEILESNPEIPTLEQLLWTARGKIEIDVELKEKGYEKEVISMILDYFSHDQFMLKSFNRSVIRKIKEIDQKIFVGLLLGESYNWRVFLEILKESFTGKGYFLDKADFISPHFKAYEMGLMFNLVRHHIPIQLWPVNNKYLLEILMKRKVHSIVTDVPERALQIREAVNGN